MATIASRIAHSDHRVAHRGQIDHSRHAREILEQHSRRREGDLDRGLRGGVPLGYRLDVRGRHDQTVFPPEQVLEQDAHAERQARDVEARALEARKMRDTELPVTDDQSLRRRKAVFHLVILRQPRLKDTTSLLDSRRDPEAAPIRTSRRRPALARRRVRGC
jgi:hypothetical protein